MKNNAGRWNVRLWFAESAAIALDTANMSVRVIALTVIGRLETRFDAAVAAMVLVTIRQRTVAEGTRLGRNQK